MKTIFYMVRCKSSGFVGFLNDALLFTRNAENGALFPSEESAQYHIGIAKSGRIIADDYMVVFADAHFRVPTRDMARVMDNSN